MHNPDDHFIFEYTRILNILLVTEVIEVLQHAVLWPSFGDTRLDREVIFLSCLLREVIFVGVHSASRWSRFSCSFLAESFLFEYFLFFYFFWKRESVFFPHAFVYLQIILVSQLNSAARLFEHQRFVSFVFHFAPPRLRKDLRNGLSNARPLICRGGFAKFKKSTALVLKLRLGFNRW